MLTIVEVIPYSSFKMRLQLMKRYVGRAYTEIYPNYIYVERVEEEIC